MPSTLYSAGQNTGVIYKHSGITSTVAAIISTPHLSNLTGITIYRDTTLISANSGSDRIFVHSGVSSTITSSFSSPSTNPTGLAVATSLDLVSSDSAADKIYVHVGTSGVIQSSFASPGSFIAGLAVGAGGPSGRLLSSDASSRKIFYHNGISSSIISSFSSPGQGPAGLAIDGSGNLVSANQRVPDGEPDRIYIHSGISATITSSFDPPSGVTPSGLYIVTSVLSSSYTKSSAKLVVPGVTVVIVYIGSATTVQPIGSTIAYAFAKSNAKISTIQYNEDLISTDDGTDRIYVHSGMSTTITSSFSAPNFGQYSVGDLAIMEGAGDLVSTWPYGSTVYIHSGRSAQVRSVIQMPWSVVGGTRLEGVEVLPNGNLITVDPLQDIIRVHAGISENVLSTFTPPGAYCAALSVATNGDLVSVDKTSNTVYIHFGVSSTIRSSFAAPGSGSVYGVAVDAAGSIMTVKTLEGSGSGKIYIHSGTASEVTSSFPSPSSYPRGIVSAPRVTSVYRFVKSSVAVSEPEVPRQHIRCLASLLVVSLAFSSFVGSSCGLAAAGVSMMSFTASSCDLTAGSVSLASFVRASCDIAAPGTNLFSFVPGNVSLIVSPSAYFLYTSLTFPRKIFIRSEMSSTILDSFSSAELQGPLTTDVSGNLLALDVSYRDRIYIHPRAIGQEVSPLTIPTHTIGIDVDENGNLVSGSRRSDPVVFYVFQGISNTVISSFGSAVDLFLTGLAVSNQGNLLTAHDLPYPEIRLHSGMSTPSSGLPSPEPESYALDLDVDQDGNLLWLANSSYRIYKHSGTTSIILASLLLPAANWLGLTASTFDIVRLAYTKSVGDISVEESNYVTSSATVGEVSFLQSSTTMSDIHAAEELNSATNVYLAALDHMPSTVALVASSRSFVRGNATVQYEEREYYRDARDFQGILGPYALGQGYGYDALFSSWASSSGHGSTYSAASHLMAADPAGTNVQTTQFSDGYVNSEGNPPPNQITGFVAGTYYVWALIGGGQGVQRLAHRVTVGGNPAEDILSSTSPNTPVWRLVGSVSYSVDSNTIFTFEFRNPDGYIHAIRAICLKNNPDAPLLTPVGNTGDVNPIPEGVEFIPSATTLNVISKIEYLRDARDFLNIQISPESITAGKHHAEPNRTAWLAAPDAPASYANARIVTAWNVDATAPYPTTNFSDTYVNDEGNPPPNRIQGFPSGNYFVWLYVHGGSGTPLATHLVQVGSEPEVGVVSPSDPTVGVWRKVGTGAYALTPSTSITVRYQNLDGNIHGFKALALTNVDVAPAAAPSGAGGDLLNTPREHANSSCALHYRATGKFLVSTDYITGRIYQHADVTPTIIRSFSAPSVTTPDPIALAVTDSGDLVVKQDDDDAIYVLQGVSPNVRSTFAAPGSYIKGRGLTVSPSGDLVSGGWVLPGFGQVGLIYVHSGLSAVIRTSFNSPVTSEGRVMGLGLGTSLGGNLLSSVGGGAAKVKVSVHSEISATVSSSFEVTVSTPGGTSAYQGVSGLDVDKNENLVTVLGVEQSIRIHSGLTSTVTSSFASPGSAPSDLVIVPFISQSDHAKSSTVIQTDGIFSHLRSSTSLQSSIVDGIDHVRSSSTIEVAASDYVGSFTTIAAEALGHSESSILLTASVLEGVLSASTLIADTGIEYANSAPNVQYGVFEYLPSSSVVQVEVTGSISSTANVQTGVTEFVASAPTLNASSREHLPSSVNLLGRPEFVFSLVSVIAENLVSSNDVPGALIYVHSGISSAVLSSFASPAGATTKGLALDSRGNLLVADADPAGGKIFTLLGISAIVRSSFSPPFAGRPTGLTVDPWDNLIGQFGANTIGVFVGMSSQVDRSFVAAATGDIAIDRNGNLITTSTDFQNIYTYAGISSTVVSSFSSPSNAPSGIVVDQDNNIISSDYGTQIIFVHSGISQTVTVTFEVPSASQRGLTTTIPPSTSPAVYIQCETDVLGTPPEFDYLSSACVVVIRAASYVSSSCEIGQQSFSYAEALCQVDVELLAHLKSATTLNIRTSGGLVSSDLTTRKIYVHKGISEVILSSFLFSGSRPNGIGVLQSGDIIACDVDGPAVYVHSGLTSTVSSSFALPYLAPAGAALDPAENLAICSQSTKLIYLHSGATSTVVSSFPAPDTSGGGAIPTGLGQTPSGNLVSLVTSGHLWGNQSKLSIHSGFSATITTSFENAWESASLLLTGVDADDFGNVLSCDVVTQSIRVHDGLTSIVAVSFASPGPEPSGLGIRAAQTVSNYVASSSVIAVISVENIIVSALLKAAEQEWLSSSAELSADDISFIAGSALANTSATPEHVISASTLEAEAREYEGSSCHLVIGSIAPEGFLSGSALLLAVEVSFVTGDAWINTAGIVEHVSSSALIQIAAQEYVACASTLLALDTSFVPSEVVLSVPGDLEYIASGPIVRASEQQHIPSSTDVVAVYIARDYCRDARDFRGMLGSYSGGRGYGYDADASQWSGSGGHGADYTSARHLTAAGAAGANIQNTQFNDSYVNRENFAPANRIQNFVAGNYYIWLYVNGGTANNAHGVTIGANPEVVVASGNGTWQWKLLGNYYVDQSTTIQFRFTSIDGYLHAIRTICLMDQPGAPADAPTGAEGDKSSSFSFGLQEVKSAAILVVETADYVKDSVQLQVDVTSFVRTSVDLAVLSYAKSLADLDGQSRQEFTNSITAVADQDVEYCSGQGALNGALQADYILGGASVHIAQRSHIKSAAALNGEAFHSFTRSSAAILTFVREFVNCQAGLATSPLQDSFSITVGGRFFLGDTFSVIRESTDSFLLDTFSVVETAEFASGFVDDFRVMSEDTQQALNSDVQIITVEVS